MIDPADRIVGLYDDKAGGWIVDRGRALGGACKTLDEVAALERLASALPPAARILDVGCGSGWPWGAALLRRGFSVVGVDASPRLIAYAQQTLPGGDWQVEDMRTFDLGQTFDAVLIWYSLFHLTPADQHGALEYILTHAAPTSVVLMTGNGPQGVRVGEWRGEPLYHASLGAYAYGKILAAAGFTPVGPGTDDKGDDSAGTLMFRRGPAPPNDEGPTGRRG